MTPEEAKAEVERLAQLLPKKEAEFEEMFKSFIEKWGDLVKGDE